VPRQQGVADLEQAAPRLAQGGFEQEENAARREIALRDPREQLCAGGRPPLQFGEHVGRDGEVEAAFQDRRGRCLQAMKAGLQRMRTRKRPRLRQRRLAGVGGERLRRRSAGARRPQVVERGERGRTRPGAQVEHASARGQRGGYQV
jgi:hypothetical protein